MDNIAHAGMLCADYRVFEGLIGPWVHVRMVGEASKCHRATKEKERGSKQRRDWACCTRLCGGDGVIGGR